MGLFGFLKTNDINVEAKGREENSILVDVREQDEYGAGHIPGAVNFPLSMLARADTPWDKSTPIYVYCLAGTRSRRAVGILQSKGYTNVKNIGGINSYHGSLEK